MMLKTLRGLRAIRKTTTQVIEELCFEDGLDSKIVGMLFIERFLLFAALTAPILLGRVANLTRSARAVISEVPCAADVTKVQVVVWSKAIAQLLLSSTGDHDREGVGLKKKQQAKFKGSSTLGDLQRTFDTLVCLPAAMDDCDEDSDGDDDDEEGEEVDDDEDGYDGEFRVDEDRVKTDGDADDTTTTTNVCAASQIAVDGARGSSLMRFDRSESHLTSQQERAQFEARIEKELKVQANKIEMKIVQELQKLEVTCSKCCCVKFDGCSSLQTGADNEKFELIRLRSQRYYL
eukprot:768728-Hanusia_phi.AAC.7